MMKRHSNVMRRRRLGWQNVVSISTGLINFSELQGRLGVIQFHTGQSEKIAVSLM